MKLFKKKDNKNKKKKGEEHVHQIFSNNQYPSATISELSSMNLFQPMKHIRAALGGAIVLIFSRETAYLSIG